MLNFINIRFSTLRIFLLKKCRIERVTWSRFIRLFCKPPVQAVLYKTSYCYLVKLFQTNKLGLTLLMRYQPFWLSLF